MINANGSQVNGYNGNEYTLICESDYPIIDVTPSKPKPGWQDQLARYTDTVQWMTPDGISHSMTLRSDSLSDLMADLKLLKSMILKAREQHAEQAGETETEIEPMTKPCPLHDNTPMKRRNSKNGGYFYSHKSQNGDWCNGRGQITN